MGKPRVIYWFRTDLRLHDSPALQAALDLSPDVLWPIFTWDPHYVYKAKGGVNRWQYLLDCQNDLSKSITKLNPKSKLFVLREGPQTLFPKLFKAWGVTHLVFERDTDTYAKQRDQLVAELARKAGVEVITRYGRTLWDSDEIVAKNGNKPTMSIVQLQHAGQKVGQIPKPIPAPKSLPDPGGTPVDFEPEEPDRDPDLNADFRKHKDKTYSTIAGPKGDFAVETLEELGFPPATTPHRGGETIALTVLGEIIANKKYTATFQKPKTSPAAFEPQATTLLSPHMHFGSLSVRLIYWKVQEVVDGYGKGASTPPESLTGQLLFRDMYFAAQAGIGAPFGQTLNNAYVRFIPWHLPSNTMEDTDIGEGPIAVSGSYRVDSPVAEKWFQRWKYGVTGFPFVDALMRQLRQEGWIHHLGRHLVACFLTRGGCYIHWERGCEVFEEWLIDHEPACNAGNWQWLSCTAFFSQFFRCYSPIAFGKKWDKSGALIRKYVPELKDLDEKYIYEPWKAPPQALAAAKVKIHGDGLHEPREGVYPEPMLDFNERRTVCLNAMKVAYKIGLHGNDEKVKDGSWKKLFEDAGEKEMEGAEIPSDDNGSEADDAEHENHKRKRGTGGRRKSDAVKQGPMDRHVKKTKAAA
ncbi:FAD binding domain of DNA photolyase-domain-containing protein [Microdochium trichocladiopsis]|uniref:FAD binding domain of DNA photolyase-domain-containing protein n=1 Tax=Microdochium trichocladiopsis TaxID=1682393 RepID=A0A9P8YJ80_9PEZI|nr:FAD binding domain of DNA photolyase-domain-containing protein [Microdochium trichocladiopsis]KAH7041270.1 FAD binding domain of DNA photolyase-domain-containing protein [Microdochium trichocladiopsis]